MDQPCPSLSYQSLFVHPSSHQQVMGGNEQRLRDRVPMRQRYEVQIKQRIRDEVLVRGSRIFFILEARQGKSIACKLGFLTPHEDGQDKWNKGEERDKKKICEEEREREKKT